MANKEMKTLTFGNDTYEIVDEKARNELGKKISDTDKGKPSGVASLDENGKIPLKQIPDDLHIEIEQSDWNETNSTDNGYIKNKIPIKNGDGEKSIIIGIGDAFGAHSIAGGTNDSSLVSSLVGSSLGSLASIDKPTAYGDMSLSFGAGTKSYASGTIALGANSTAGAKGFYWWSIDFSNKKITLAINQITSVLFGNKIGTRKWDDSAKTQLANWKSGDKITLVANVKYGECSTITAVDSTNGTITVDKLPITEEVYPSLKVFDDYAVYVPSKPTNGVAQFALGGVSIGLETNAAGSFSLATGWKTKAITDFGHTEGIETIADYAAHAEGQGSKALGKISHAEGANTTATGYASHTEGEGTVASHAESHAEGGGSIASAWCSHAEGHLTQATNSHSHAEGEESVASGTRSHAEGYKTQAQGENSHAEGYNTQTIGSHAHAEGHTTEAKYSAHAEGGSTKAYGNYSHAEGLETRTGANASCAHAEGRNTVAEGYASHSEGSSTVSNGEYSHAEGYLTHTYGNYSHSEGNETVAFGLSSHVEGKGNISGLGGKGYYIAGVFPYFKNFINVEGEGYNSYVEGEKIIIFGNSQSVPVVKNRENWTPNGFYVSEDFCKIICINDSTEIDECASKWKDKQICVALPNNLNIFCATVLGSALTLVEFEDSNVGMTGKEILALHVKVNDSFPTSFTESIVNADDYVVFCPQCPDVGNTTLTNKGGENSHSEGENTLAYGKNSHAEGYNTKALREHAHAEGHSTESKYCGHAEGGATKAYGNYSHAEGNGTQATNSCTHAEGGSTVASGKYAHVEGFYSQATGEASHAEGASCQATGSESHAQGSNTIASKYCSHAEGYNTKASSSYQHVQGKWNQEDITSTYLDIVGWGSSSTPANVYTLDTKGNAWYKGSVTSNGADYAEYFEWLDENTENEDRIGLIVALDGEKIKLANSNDEILGIISGTAAVLGDNYECEWNGKYLTDDFGRVQYEEVEEFYDVVIGFDEETNEPIIEKQSLGFFKHPILNQNYDLSKEYINRADRQEWATVGMLGKLYVRDDGTCKVNEYATVGENGVATASSENTNMRVLSRVNKDVIRVLLK